MPENNLAYADYFAAMTKQADSIRQLTIIELVELVWSCNSFEEFKKKMYEKAINYVKGYEETGVLSKGTLEKILAEADQKVAKDK